MRIMMVLAALALAGALLVGARTEAQSSAAAQSLEQLRSEIAARGDAMFATVMGEYGKCDLEKFASFFAEDLEFFHDNDGLITPLAKLLVASKNVCGTHRRELVAGTREIYPIPGYGAIEAGSHRFFRRKEGSSEEIGGTVAAKYLHIWRHQDGQWKITHVISYAH